ncbi:MAG: YfiR family protein [Ectothiorhodospiraceae bacterium]|nr:YfiR family protein [Ectothiorhodospiraceae bacterium]
MNTLSYKTCLIIGGLLFLSMGFSFAATPAYKIKAAYIYQLTRFVTWPNVPRDINSPFNICVLGKTSIGKELKNIENRQEYGRQFHVIYPKNLTDTDMCHIIYLAKSNQNELRAMLDLLEKQPVLTISSVPDFAYQGGVIGFVTDKNRIRMEINHAASLRANIQLSAKLLELAIPIKGNSSREFLR